MDMYTYIKNGKVNELRELKDTGVNIISTASILWAAFNGQLEVCKYLVSVGSNIKTAECHDLIAWPARYGHLNVVQYLVSAGANVSVNNNRAIEWAIEFGKIDVVKYLFSVGASTRKVNVDNKSVLGLFNAGCFDVLYEFLGDNNDHTDIKQIVARIHKNSIINNIGKVKLFTDIIALSRNVSFNHDT